MEIKVGGKYRDRMGKVVSIAEYIENNQYPFCGDNGLTFNKFGKWYAGEINTRDLIEEIKEDQEPVHPSTECQRCKKLLDIAKVIVRILE